MKNNMFNLKNLSVVSICVFLTVNVNAIEVPKTKYTNELLKIKLETEFLGCQETASSVTTVTSNNPTQIPIQIKIGREIPYIATISTDGVKKNKVFNTLFDGFSYSFVANANEEEVEVLIKAEKTEVYMDYYTINDKDHIQAPLVTLEPLNKTVVIPNGMTKIVSSLGKCSIKIKADIITNSK